MDYKTEEQKKSLALSTRAKIYRIVKKSPGLHFREIQRRSRLAIGNLQYQLEVLQKNHLLKASKHGKFVRYYSVQGEPAEADALVLSLLRQESIRRIVLFLLTEKKGTNFSIASAIGLSPSTTSWHVKKLLDAGIAEKRSRGKKRFFYLANPEQISTILVNYKRSFLDELVDNFVETFEQLSVEQ